MKHCTYIIYSSLLNRYYIGETEDFVLRLQQHNNGYYIGSYTTKTNDWQEYLVIPCPDKTTAIKLEAFVKRMKSRKFIEQLKQDKSMQESILSKL